MLPLVRNLFIEAVYWRWRCAGCTTFAELQPHVRAILDDCKMPPVPTDEEGLAIIKDLELRCLFETELPPTGIVLGITGTRHGMTDQQGVTLAKFFLDLKPREFHHGDCVGVDAEAHDLYCSIIPHAIIIGHPPDNDAQRAFCPCSELLPPLPYLVRNQAIVDASDIVIAIPQTEVETRRSGTWSTVWKARQARKPLHIILPNGSTRDE